jgi:hypothetical protein
MSGGRGFGREGHGDSGSDELEDGGSQDAAAVLVIGMRNK